MLCVLFCFRTVMTAGDLLQKLQSKVERQEIPKKLRVRQTKAFDDLFFWATSGASLKKQLQVEYLHQGAVDFYGVSRDAATKVVRRLASHGQLLTGAPGSFIVHKLVSKTSKSH